MSDVWLRIISKSKCKAFYMNPSQIRNALYSLTSQALKDIENAKTLEEIEKVRIKYFGKNGRMNQIKEVINKQEGGWKIKLPPWNG
jgi:hypothetical protein